MFRLELVGGYDTNISMDIEAIDGTAVRGQDYRMDTTTVTFTGQQGVRYVKAPVIDDAGFEGGVTESFTLRLHNASHPVIPGKALEIAGIAAVSEAELSTCAKGDARLAADMIKLCTKAIALLTTSLITLIQGAEIGVTGGASASRRQHPGQ